MMPWTELSYLLLLLRGISAQSNDTTFSSPPADGDALTLILGYAFNIGWSTNFTSYKQFLWQVMPAKQQQSNISFQRESQPHASRH
jgi:hypothetical protein